MGTSEYIESFRVYTFGFDPRLLISVVFVAVSANIIFFQVFPQFHSLLRYGKIAQQKQVSPDTQLSKIVERILAIQVPKSWFLHYYVFYLALQWFQGIYIWYNSLPLTKNTIIWALMTFQATRRVLESYTLTKWNPKLTMHVTHYHVGLLYYLGISSNCFLGLLDNNEPLQWTWMYVVLVLVFFLSSIDQFLNHKHLASLKKYSVPTFNLFKVVACAHYFDEIIIYLVVLLILFVQTPYSIPDFNFLGSWVFVVTNLSVSANGSHLYYKEKFDNYKVKYAAIPYLF